MYGSAEKLWWQEQGAETEGFWVENRQWFIVCCCALDTIRVYFCPNSLEHIVRTPEIERNFFSVACQTVRQTGAISSRFCANKHDDISVSPRWFLGWVNTWTPCSQQDELRGARALFVNSLGDTMVNESRQNTLLFIASWLWSYTFSQIFVLDTVVVRTRTGCSGKLYIFAIMQQYILLRKFRLDCSFCLVFRSCKSKYDAMVRLKDWKKLRRIKTRRQKIPINNYGEL